MGTRGVLVDGEGLGEGEELGWVWEEGLGEALEWEGLGEGEELGWVWEEGLGEALGWWSEDELGKTEGLCEWETTLVGITEESAARAKMSKHFSINLYTKTPPTKPPTPGIKRDSQVRC